MCTNIFIHAVLLKLVKMLHHVVFLGLVLGTVHSLAPDHRHVTYQVQRLYQACPSKGQIVVNGSYTQGSDLASVRSKLRELEDRVVNLEAVPGRLDKLEAKISALEDHCGGNNGPKICHVRNITRLDGKYPRDCTEVYTLGGRATGVYIIHPRQAPKPISVLCELGLDGGWTVIMRRFDGSVDFYRRWSDYKNGFGSLDGEHWLGNDNIHRLTSQKNYRLLIDVRYWASKISYYSSYDRFSIENEARKYTLHIAGFKGNVGHEGLLAFNGKPFTTWDRDNDAYSGNCAQLYKGGFWYYHCHALSHPTGLYKLPCSAHDCIEWGKHQALDQIIMKVKHI